MANGIGFRLYLVTDRRLFASTGSLFTAVEDALRAGVRAVQLREKDINIRELLNMAYCMKELTDRYGARLFINDRVDVAIAVEAHGVHLGQGSIPASAAKKVSKGRLIVGVSTHSITEALDAAKDGADFITFGPIYQTSSKLKYGEPVGINALKIVRSEVSIPIMAIGGIKIDKINEVMDSGADGVAVISAILGSGNIKQTTEDFLRCLQ